MLKSIKHWFGVEESTELFEEVNPRPINKEERNQDNYKVCPCCGEKMHIENFVCIDREKNVREFVCRKCSNFLKTNIKRKTMVAQLKNNCVFTGVYDNIICDFHHTYGKKAFTLSNVRRNSPAKVLIEGFKCIVCDSNSHRRVHYYDIPEHQKNGEFSYKKDHIDAYLLMYYTNFIHVCYGYLLPMYGDFSTNQNVYVPNKNISTKKQIKEARYYLYYLLIIIAIREKYLSIEI